MNFSQDNVLQASEKEAANLLYQAGLTLSGKPLRRSSWLEIARSILRRGRLSAVLLARLHGATSRADALRALRMARRETNTQRRKSTGKGRPQRQPGQTLIQIHRQEEEEGAYFEGWYVEHAIGYVMLVEEVFPAADFRIRRRHVRRFWEQYQRGEMTFSTPPNNLESLNSRFGLDRMLEGLAHALLVLLHEQWPGLDGHEQSLKESFILALRTLSLHYRGAELENPIWVNPADSAPEAVRTLVEILLRQGQHAPLELAQALGIAHEQGLPLLVGGRMTEWEHRTRHVLREAAGGVVRHENDLPLRVFTCRPLDKLAALDRGTLAGDCSSSAVPLRATSPHHTYYGIWENDTQQRGYMTVFEAWAEREEGERVPVLCLETINVPIPIFDAVQQDLLVIFEAIAHSRGLHTPLVLTLGHGTWNYQNGTVLRHSRRFRQGEVVTLLPADPVHWQIYSRASGEAYYYNSFQSYRSAETIRILAPFDPAQDMIQPENLIESERLTALPPCKLIPTLRKGEEVAGFISAWPADPEMSP